MLGLTLLELLGVDEAVDAELLGVLEAAVVELDDELGFGLGLCLGGDFSAGTAELAATPVTATVRLPLTPVLGASWDAAACAADCCLVAEPIANAAPKPTITSKAIRAMRRRMTVPLSRCVPVAPSGAPVSLVAAAPSMLRPHLDGRRGRIIRQTQAAACDSRHRYVQYVPVEAGPSRDRVYCQRYRGWWYQ